MEKNNNSKQNSNSEQILKDSIFKVGKVISVKGRSIEIQMDKTKNVSHLLYKGDLLKNVSVSSYVKIFKGFTKIIGKIEGEYIKEDKYSTKSGYGNNQQLNIRKDRYIKTKEYGNEREKIDRILNISLLGFFGSKGFERGIKELPLIDNECFLLEKEEFNAIHNFIKSDDEGITIGSLSLEKGQAIKVDINSLFASHIGIFGNTGSGKSYTLAKIYKELFDKYKDNNNFQKNSKFLLIDFNGEYIKEDVIIKNQYKNVYNLSTREHEHTRSQTNKFPISEESIKDPTFWIMFLTATEKTQAPFLKRTLAKDEINSFQIEQTLHEIITNEDRSIEKGVIFNFLKEVELFLENDVNISNLRSKLKYHSTQNTYYVLKGDDKVYANDHPDQVFEEIIKFLAGNSFQNHNIFTLKNNLSDLHKTHLKIIFYYYSEIVSGFSNQEHLAPLIKRLEKRLNTLNKVIHIQEEESNENKESNKFFTIVSLKEVNIDMKKILPLLICKQLYDKQKSNNDKGKSLHLIIDEAHNILSQVSERESLTWKDYRLETFEEIIKEGRKFGVFLTVASQRPHDISSTIISQLHNYFLHRLINNNDIIAVEKTIAYLDKLSVEYLSILPTGTCILAGLLAHVPVTVDIGKIEEGHEPDNKTLQLTQIWKSEDTSQKSNPKSKV